MSLLAWRIEQKALTISSHSLLVHASFMFRSCYNSCMRGTIRLDTERLRRLRRERALSQRALAREAGVGLDTVNKLETGVRDALPVTLRKLAYALGVEPYELMKGV